MSKTFLFLQGPMGPFFDVLGDTLVARGHHVARINFNGGDRFFWKGKPSIDFSGELSAWNDFVKTNALFLKTTDLVVYGDCRQFHRIAIKELKALGIAIHVFEEGYLRPDWVTLENDGVNDHSSLSRDPEFYRMLPELADPELQPVGKTLLSMAFYASLYAFATLIRPGRLSRGWRHHSGISLLQFVRVWPSRLFTLPVRKAEALLKRRQLRGTAYFLVPLQLGWDTQITHHSSFDSVSHFVDEVVESFANHAPLECSLVFKNHPLSIGVIPLRRYVREAAEKYRLTARVRFIDAGPLPGLVRGARGVVTINSTSGISAIHHRCPTITLGKAIYNFTGLTFQGPLNAFWTKLEKPDRALYKQFRAYVLRETQLNGSFYTRHGRALLLDDAVKKLVSRKQPVSAGQYSQLTE